MKLLDLFKQENRDELYDRILTFILCVVLPFVSFSLVALVTAMLCSCRTIHEVKEVTKHDTLIVNNTKRDSIVLRDSIYVETMSKGDTIILYKYKERVQYIDRYLHDSIYVSKVDTCYIERKEKEEPTLAQRTKQFVGGLFIAAIATLAAFFGIRWLMMKMKK